MLASCGNKSGIPSAISNLGDAGRDAGLLAAATAKVVPFARKLSLDLTWLALRFPRGPSPAESHRPFGLRGFSFLLSEMAAKKNSLFNFVVELKCNLLGETSKTHIALMRV